jgi:hypothetical protein
MPSIRILNAKLSAARGVRRAGLCRMPLRPAHLKNVTMVRDRVQAVACDQTLRAPLRASSAFSAASPAVAASKGLGNGPISGCVTPRKVKAMKNLPSERFSIFTFETGSFSAATSIPHQNTACENRLGWSSILSRSGKIWCPHQDSNPGPPDYKSGALPTEL